MQDTYNQNQSRPPEPHITHPTTQPNLTLFRWWPELDFSLKSFIQLRILKPSNWDFWIYGHDEWIAVFLAHLQLTWDNPSHTWGWANSKPTPSAQIKFASLNLKLIGQLTLPTPRMPQYRENLWLAIWAKGMRKKYKREKRNLGIRVRHVGHGIVIWLAIWLIRIRVWSSTLTQIRILDGVGSLNSFFNSLDLQFEFD